MTLTPYESGTILAEGQGPYAPEILVSPAYSRRFIGTPKDGRSEYLIVTDYYAVVSQDQYDEGDPRMEVLNGTEMLWTNSLDEPGQYEVDSEYDWNEGAMYYASAGDAERDAINELKQWGLDTWVHLFATKEEDA